MALESVADDINWSSGLDLPVSFDPIAPSAHLPNLPEVQVDAGMDVPPPKTGNTNTNNNNNNPPPPPGDVPPPPPPPPGPSSAPPPPPPLTGAPPPPPPPSSANIPTAVAAPSGGRSALLDALRNPDNKNKLKKAGKDKKGRERKKKEAAAPSVDIVDALRQALSRRNKSIMGGMDAMARRSNEDTLEDDEDEDAFALPDIDDD